MRSAAFPRLPVQPFHSRSRHREKETTQRNGISCLPPIAESPLLCKPRQSVDAAPVLFLLVGLESLWTFLLCPGEHLIPLALILHQRDSPPARIGNPGHFDDNNGPRALVLRKVRSQSRKFL